MSEALLDAIGRRNLFGIFRSAFHKYGLPVSQGWAKTREALEISLDDPQQADATLKSLEQAYQDNLLYANKAVVLWALPDNLTAETVYDLLESFLSADSPYLESYPFPLGEQELKASLRLAVPTVVHDESYGDARAGKFDEGRRKTLVLAGKRWFNEEIEVVAAQLTPDARAELDGVTEIVAKRRVIYPVYDIICIDRSRRLVELRIDQAKNLTERDVLQYRTHIQELINKLARDICGIEQLLGNPMNLYPALQPMYEGEQWVVHAIEHTNDGGYLNKNTGRHRSSDVRQDDYHSGGEEAVKAIHLHSLTAIWERPAGNFKLVIHGHSKILSSQNPNIDYVKILDCWDRQTYYDALGTLISSLPPGP